MQKLLCLMSSAELGRHKTVVRGAFSLLNVQSSLHRLKQGGEAFCLVEHANLFELLVGSL